MSRLDDLAAVLDQVDQPQGNQLLASCPCPGHDSPLQLVAVLEHDGGVRAKCRGGCSSWVLQSAIQARLSPRLPGVQVLAGQGGVVTIPTDWRPTLQSREAGPDCQTCVSDPKEEVRDILRRIGGRGGLKIFEAANQLSELIMKDLVKSGARLLQAGGRGFLLADGTLMLLEPQNPELQSLLLLRFGLLFSDPVVKPVLANWNIIARAVRHPIPLRAGNFTDCTTNTFYMALRDQVLRIGPEGKEDRIGNGVGVAFLGLATHDAPNIPAPLPPLGRFMTLLDVIPFAEGPLTKPFDSWVVIFSWVMSALMQDVVRPVPFLVLGGDPEVAAVLARILAALVAGHNLHAEIWLHEGDLRGIVGTRPVALLDVRSERISKWFAAFLDDARAGYVRPDRFLIDAPVAPIAMTHLILVPRPQDIYADVLPEHAIVVRVGSGDTVPLRAAGADRDELVGALAGFIKELLPVLARHPAGLPVTFTTFVRIVFETLGGTAEGAPDITVFRPEVRPVPSKPRKLDDLLLWISFWLQSDPVNLNRFLRVADLYPELVDLGRRLRTKPYFKNAASLAQYLKQQEGDLVEILGFQEQFPGGRRRLIGFTKAGEGQLPPLPRVLLTKEE